MNSAIHRLDRRVRKNRNLVDRLQPFPRAGAATAIRLVLVCGAGSLRAIAPGLNVRGIPTARGAGQWSAVQVARVIERHSYRLPR